MEIINYQFDWSILWQEPYGSMMLKGMFTTVLLSFLAWCIAVVVGITIGVFRVVPVRGLRIFGTCYVQVFRNIPFLVHLFFWYYAAPLLLPESGQMWLYDTVPNYAFLAGVMGLGTYTASRVAEQFRAGFLSISPGQFRAAFASGLTPFQTYRYVIIPLAFRIILPSFTTEFLTCFKNSALTMTIGVMEITHTAYYIDSFTWHGLETTTAASLVYLTLGLSVVTLMGQVEKRIKIPGMITRGN